MMTQRRVAVQGLSVNDRATDLSSVSFDAFLTKAYILFHDAIDNEIEGLNGYEKTCNDYLGFGESNIRVIDKSLSDILNSNGPMTSAQFSSFYNNYFSPDSFEQNRLMIKAVIDRADKFIRNNNTLYSGVLNTMSNYVNNVTTPTTSNTQYVPPLPAIPQFPQTTRCTLGTIGGGGVELVMKCTTSSY
jgi:ribosomal protein S17E